MKRSSETANQTYLHKGYATLSGTSNAVFGAGATAENAVPVNNK